MTLNRRLFTLAATAALLGCASAPAVDPQVRAALAPTGTLRVALTQGAPTSMVKTAGGQTAGVGHDMAQAIGRALGAPVQVVLLERAAQTTEAVKSGAADLTFTNATEARAREVAFAAPLVRLELGYLVPAGSTLRAANDMAGGRPKVGVTQGSTTQSVLPRLLPSATLVPLPSMAAVAQQLRERQIDAFATNKGALFELSDQVPGSRVLDGRWGLEHFALAVPKGREAALPWLDAFGQRAQRSGELKAMLDRAGLRGTATD